MTTGLVIGIVVFLTALDVAIVWSVVHLGWRDLPARFPARPAAPDALAGRFQSFRVGIVNFGFSIHVQVDPAHLHLTPIRPLQVLGARPASVPWEAMRVESRKSGRRWTTVRAGGIPLRGPAWCLELAGN